MDEAENCKQAADALSILTLPPNDALWSLFSLVKGIATPLIRAQRRPLILSTSLKWILLETGHVSK